jgi:hypothetical protein
MAEFDVVFEKLAELTEDCPGHQLADGSVTRDELDEIEELRRFSSEIQDSEPASFTTT